MITRMTRKTIKTINVRKIFRDINKKIKEHGNILITIDGDERKGMSCEVVKLNFELHKTTPL